MNDRKDELSNDQLVAVEIKKLLRAMCCQQRTDVWLQRLQQSDSNVIRWQRPSRPHLP
jgi:hypothetical protein